MVDLNRESRAGAAPRFRNDETTRFTIRLFDRSLFFFNCTFSKLEFSTGTIYRELVNIEYLKFSKWSIELFFFNICTYLFLDLKMNL